MGTFKRDTVNETLGSDSSKESLRTTRKFINSAIYIEKPVSTTPSDHKSLSERISIEDMVEIKTKRCTCAVDQKTCPCHRNCSFNIMFKSEKLHSHSAKTLEIKPKTSTLNIKSCSNLNNGREIAFNEWVAKKERQKKKKELEEQALREAQAKEREKRLAQERKNFNEWLQNKKKAELQSKKKAKVSEDQQLNELENEKRELERQLNFQLWLKRKQEAQLEKKIQHQVRLISELENKETKVKENQRAYQEWLKNAKNRQKPVPLNRGLQSLCSTKSVSFVNPRPWNPHA